ncbi:MAG: hypothetical protein BWX98_02403 [Candidatus Aminicenantes bacterium ADurb.Bin147]|nr:MAG: hypothetical protein BWX98_02403 [Candidatus Aminicenantes bacterium ADurb.Bin147]
MIGFPDISRREKLQVEADPALEGGRQRFVQIDGDAEPGTRRLDPHGIGRAGPGESGRHPDRTPLPVDLPLARFGPPAPLSRRFFEADVSHGCHPFAVLDDFHSALLAFRINVVEDQDGDSRGIQVFLGSENPGRSSRVRVRRGNGRGDRPENQGRKPDRRRFHFASFPPPGGAVPGEKRGTALSRPAPSRKFRN